MVEQFTRVRIAVLVFRDGSWNAAGQSGHDDEDAETWCWETDEHDDIERDGARLWFVEATLPVPEPAPAAETVEGVAVASETSQ